MNVAFDAPSPRIYPKLKCFAGVCSLDGKVYVIGGWNGQRGLTRCDLYNPTTKEWTETQTLNTGKQ